MYQNPADHSVAGVTDKNSMCEAWCEVQLVGPPSIAPFAKLRRAIALTFGTPFSDIENDRVEAKSVNNSWLRSSQQSIRTHSRAHCARCSSTNSFHPSLALTSEYFVVD